MSVTIPQRQQVQVIAQAGRLDLQEHGQEKAKAQQDQRERRLVHLTPAHRQRHRRGDQRHTRDGQKFQDLSEQCNHCDPSPESLTPSS